RLIITTAACRVFWLIRCCAACATILDTRTWSPKSVYPQGHEQQRFILLRTQATQRVQGCIDLCRRGVAASWDRRRLCAAARRAGVDYLRIPRDTGAWLRASNVHFMVL